MQPLAVLKCLGKALLRSAGNAVGFGVAGDLIANAGEEAWREWNRDKREAERQAELQALLHMAKEEFRAQVEEVVREVAADQPQEVQEQVSQGLQQVPDLVRQSLRRPSDKSMPESLPLQRSDDFVSLLSSARPQMVPQSLPNEDMPPPSVTLSLMNGPKKGTRFTFTERATCLVGRQKDCRVRFPADETHKTISRHHCLLDINPPDVFVRDLGSLRGTYVNGELIGKRVKGMDADSAKSLTFKDVKLEDGYQISLGEKNAIVIGVSIYVPATCFECRVHIREEDKAECEKEPHVYFCKRCRDKADAVRSCSQCGRGVAGETGADRPGAFICRACRQNPDQLLENYQSQGPSKRKGIPVIDGYTIRKKLGRGGMGEVWLAQHKKSDQMVAIKLTLPEVAADERSVSRALRELTNHRLLRHRNLVQLLNVEYSSGMFVMVLEYCDGGTVSQLMRQRGGTLPVDEAVEITLQALEGLHHAHNVLGDGRGLVHRDISPDNIFLSGQGSARLAKIGDYGLAKSFDDAGLSGSTRTGEAAGKPHFLPRLQVVEFKNVGPEVDVWATAASLYNMLTNDVPRDFSKGGDPWLTVLEEDAVPIRARNSSIPEGLASVIDSALAEEPELRFKTAKAFQGALEEA